MKKPTLRLSSCGHCARELAFGLHGFPRPPFTAAARKRMDMGAVFEAEVIARLQREGLAVTDQQRPVQLAGILGHIDGILETDGRRYLLEIKSGSWFSFSDFQKNGLRFAKSHFIRQYYAQVMAYCAALRASGEDIDAVRVEYAHRDDRKPNPAEGDFGRASEILAFDEAEAERVRARLAAVIAAKGPDESLREYSLDDGFLPDECRFTKADGEFFGCDFAAECWPGLVQIGRKWAPASALEF